jgi:hypothetical protein
VKNGDATAHRSINGGPISNIAFDQRDFIEDFGQVLPSAGCKVVENDDFVSLFENVSGKIRTDKSRSASNEVLHRTFLVAQSYDCGSDFNHPNRRV